MINTAALEDLFDLSYKVDEMILDYLCDEISQSGFEISSIENLDSSIYVEFYSPIMEKYSVNGTIRIDRMSKQFEVTAQLNCQDDCLITYAGSRTSEFDGVLKYLHLLYNDTITYVEELCIKKEEYCFQGLRFRPDL
jgi:hypothetical protein